MQWQRDHTGGRALQRNRGGRLYSGLDSPTVKWISRNGLEYSFLPGKGLWRNATREAEIVAVCSAHDFGRGEIAPYPRCKDFLDANERARMQWELELSLAAFEKKIIENLH